MSKTELECKQNNRSPQTLKYYSITEIMSSVKLNNKAIKYAKRIKILHWKQMETMH